MKGRERNWQTGTEDKKWKETVSRDTHIENLQEDKMDKTKDVSTGIQQLLFLFFPCDGYAWSGRRRVSLGILRHRPDSSLDSRVHWIKVTNWKKKGVLWLLRRRPNVVHSGARMMSCLSMPLHRLDNSLSRHVHRIKVNNWKKGDCFITVSRRPEAVHPEAL